MPKNPNSQSKMSFFSTEPGMWVIVVALAIAAMGAVNLISGCSLLLKGSGEMGIGMRDSMFVIYHDVDPDKADVSAKSTLEINDSVLEAVLGTITSDEPSDEVSPPSTPDPE